MSSDTGTTAIALFVRVPVPGRVKTRLAATLGEHAACELYHAMVADILASIGASGLPLLLFHDEGNPRLLPASWVTAATTISRQSPGDIGARMAAAFAQCFADRYEQVLLCGSDIPGIDASVLAAANQALTDHDAVMLPTLDGGYGLIGLKHGYPHRPLFEGIAWSTDQVFATTLERLLRLNVKSAVLSKQRDIDTLDDLRHYQRSPAPAAAFTNQYLAAMVAAGIIPW
jgi:uncharacterized protein